MSYKVDDLVAYGFEQGQKVLAKRPEKERKQKGQFLTPVSIARFMAQQLGPIQTGDRMLDPAIGSGVLACAVIERAIIEGQPREFWLDGYELDPELYQIATDTLTQAAKAAEESGIIVHVRVYKNDFVLNNVPVSQPQLLVAENSNHPNPRASYTHIIANPPYFKLNSNDARVKAVAGQVKGHTNIYTLFLALAMEKLASGGRACFVVPRSFCSGLYFSALRQQLAQKTHPIAVHLFESRQEIFQDEGILQESIIYTFSRPSSPLNSTRSTAYLNISASKDTTTLNKSLPSRPVPLKHFLGRRNGTLFFRLPTGELDEQIIEIIDSWDGTLNKYGLEVSTGPVVAFRAQDWLMDVEATMRHKAVPLLWMQNVQRQQIEWPISNGQKPQAISQAKNAQSLLTPATNYVLLRRFTAKEEPRRLIAAPFLVNQYGYQWIGLENHLNYIYRKQGALTEVETIGLSALLNSSLIDRYFRIVNGNTQVNATELRALPLPPLEIIQEIGTKLLKQPTSELEKIVYTHLWEAGHLSLDIPILWETRITMGKIQEAQEILKSLGLPANQQNEISALTLLVLAQITEDIAWGQAKKHSLRIHDILLAIKEHYGREYAENTRETIRRQVIHQFIQAGLVVRNPDDPTLPTNSPHTHYGLSEAGLKAIRAHQSQNWEQTVRAFIESRGALLEIYQKSREQHRVPLRLANGEEYHLSPGRHNELQVAIIEEFGPRFAPGAKLLYLGDTENKTLILDASGFEELGIPIPNHDKLPDIVLYDEQRNWLFLIEAVTSHGPISPKRHLELEELIKDSLAGCVYVSAFPNFTTFKNFLTEIAWETDVWIAEIADHLIHFNGDQFLGPRV